MRGKLRRTDEVRSAMRSAKCEVRSAKCEVRSAKCEVRSAKLEVAYASCHANLLHGRCMTCVCLTKHADLQVASDGGPNDPTKWQEISRKLPEMKSTMSQAMASLTTYVTHAGRELPPPPVPTLS